MDIIPVLDLQHGVVVRGVAGQRETYRPLDSCWAESPDPGQIAGALRDHFGFDTVYVADLDAIAGRGDHLRECRALIDAGFHILLDCGIHVAADAAAALDAKIPQLIVGLESVAGPHVLQELVDRFGPERILFSLDLKAGSPLGDTSAWGTNAPEAIAARAVSSGIRHIIVLDLARVGISQGLSTLDLCAHLRQTHPQLSIITGGGVRTLSDLSSLRAAGLHGALVSTALHNGALTPEALRAFAIQERSPAAESAAAEAAGPPEPGEPRSRSTRRTQ